MADASRCPRCREPVHPFAAGCPSCGADLDAWRRQQAQRPRRRISLPTISSRTDVTDLVLISLILLVLALFAPLIGAVLSLFVAWQSHHNARSDRRTAALVCAAVALVNLFDPNLIAVHLI